jgi:hypothetical protein
VVSFWARRTRGADDLFAAPLPVAVPQLELTLGEAAVSIDSLILTPAGLRGRDRAESELCLQGASFELHASRNTAYSNEVVTFDVVALGQATNLRSTI